MKDYGLLQGPREIEAYILGSSKVPLIPYCEDGDWEKYLPEYEPQAESYETSGCTVWGSQNQVEIFYKRVFGVEPNYSERFTYNLVPVNPKSGADPQNTYETIRKTGLIKQRYLPVPETLDEFTDKGAITQKLLDMGQKWLSRHELKHEWAWTLPPKTTKERIEILRYLLRTSPLAVSVTAWIESNGVFIDGGMRNNHWCVLYKIDEDGYPWVMDSYDHYKKRLHPDHQIQRVKRIWLNKKTRPAMRRHIKILEDILKSLQLMEKTIIDICKENLGRDASPSDLAPDELGCAETVTTLLKQIYPETPIITGTWTLWDYFRKNDTVWFPLLEPEPGCVVICATGTGNGKFPGHTGILLDDGTIASNDSWTGRLERNYDLDTWKKRYQSLGGFPVYYYKHK